MLRDNFSYYIDCKLEDFVEEVNSLTFQELIHLKKMFEMEYQRIVFFKVQIIIGIDLGNIDKIEGSKLIEDIYKLLFNIEERAKIVEACRKELLGSIENENLTNTN